MDYELIFWCVAALGALAFAIGIWLSPSDEYISEPTLRRLRGERTH